MKKVLKHKIEIPIRFSETDAMGVVWHGNYLKFYEDAREQFGKAFQLHYLDMFNQGMLTPIVHSELFHKASLYYGDSAIVESTFVKQAAAKLKFEFKVYSKKTGALAAHGSTTQVFMDNETRELQLNKPDFFIDWESNQTWEDGE